MILLLLYYCNILKWFTITFNADKIFLLILFIYGKSDYLGALAETINDGSRILVEHTIHFTVGSAVRFCNGGRCTSSRFRLKTFLKIVEVVTLLYERKL